ncbi:MAG: hypothetical protein ACTSVA_08270 [Candidatus Njordarchaeales archaeon]
MPNLKVSVRKYIILYFLLLITIQLIGTLLIVLYLPKIPNRSLKFFFGIIIATFIGLLWPIILALIIQQKFLIQQK